MKCQLPTIDYTLDDAVFSYFKTLSQKPGGQSNHGTIGVQRPAIGEYNQYSSNLHSHKGLTVKWRPSTNEWRDFNTSTCRHALIVSG
ncbi:hypothetical protein PMIN06_002289 [Paraphaeosphaeria minitans]